MNYVDNTRNGEEKKRPLAAHEKKKKKKGARVVREKSYFCHVGRGDKKVHLCVCARGVTVSTKNGGTREAAGDNSRPPPPPPQRCRHYFHRISDVKIGRGRPAGFVCVNVACFVRVLRPCPSARPPVPRLPAGAITRSRSPSSVSFYQNSRSFALIAPIERMLPAWATPCVRKGTPSPDICLTRISDFSRKALRPCRTADTHSINGGGPIDQDHVCKSAVGRDFTLQFSD